jgi:3-carboxy-cis,cis-muconate cycloisomerase
VSALVFDHPWMEGLFRGRELREHFSVAADISAMLQFETALARASAEYGLIPESASTAITEACDRFVPDMDLLQKGFARDGVVVPALLSQLRDAMAGDAEEYLHLGATSQDVIDTSLVLRIKHCLGLLLDKLASVKSCFENLATSTGDKIVMAHTRMQPARMIKATCIIDAWREPLIRHSVRINEMSGRILQLQLGGPTGDLSLLGVNGSQVRLSMANELGLGADQGCWHSTRDGLAELASWCSLVSGNLGKFGQDVSLMSQAEIGSIKVAGTGGSSSMANKQNPVAAEVLVTIARFNATQVSAMHQALVHENQRSGAAWTLEWMVLPQMILATNASLGIAIELASNIDFVEKP